MRITASQRWVDALRRYGPANHLTLAYQARVEDIEEAKLVESIMLRGDDSARRVRRRLTYRLGETPPPREPHPG